MHQDKPKKILVVDDDARIRDLLRRYLTQENYEVFVAEDAKTMQRVMVKERFDLIVLDLMLPGEDGLTVCKRMRASKDFTPIIMLTAKGEDVDRIIGLEVGADDYLPKPFNPRELLGRIRAVLRRAAHAPRDPNPQTVRAFSFGGWQLDTTRRTLTGAVGEVPLSGAEYRLLAVLLSAGNRVVTRTQLAELLRGREADPFDRSIDVRVSRLRQILGDEARSPRIIKTVYGEGYVIGVPVETD